MKRSDRDHPDPLRRASLDSEGPDILHALVDVNELAVRRLLLACFFLNAPSAFGFVFQKIDHSLTVSLTV